MRSLEKDQIQDLAERIVEEIRERGPFLSLAEFVNRRPSSDKELAMAGALQAAIDKTPKINERFAEDSKAFAGEDLTGFSFPEAMGGMNAAGAPGYLTQGDILSAIGPVVAVRSDTFRIRTYGEALDPESKVIARPWCSGSRNSSIPPTNRKPRRRRSTRSTRPSAAASWSPPSAGWARTRCEGSLIDHRVLIIEY
jgi:hypothetical protein